MIKASHLLLVLGLIFTGASFSSCKKEKKTDPDPVVKGTVTADIDGKASDFSKFAISLTGSSGGDDFTAVQGDAADGSSIGVTVYGALTAGKTYTPENEDFGTQPIVSYSVGDDVYLPDLHNPIVSVTITAVSSSAIQGRFSGTVINITAGANKGKIKVIANGKFNVQR